VDVEVAWQPVIVGCPRLRGRKGGMSEEIQLVRGNGARGCRVLGLCGGFRIAFRLDWYLGDID
jgi:hypothetical protein